MAVTTIGGNVLAIGVVAVSTSPASVAANTTAERTVTVPGVRVGDYVDATAPSVTAGLGVDQSRVTAADTVAILFQNSTAGALVPPSGVYQFLVIRPEYANAASFSP